MPYLLDSREAGANKALMSVGRVVSEEPGMKACADWLKSLVPEAAGRRNRRGRSLLEPARMTAQEIVTRIRQRLADQGITWRTETVDTFKAGNPDAAVSGIATTGMATFDVLKRAAKAGRNFVITHEPTFYNHQDQTAAFEQDATYQAKQRFIREHNLVVWRFHDHAHAIRPDPLVVGSARMLGWSSYASPTEPRIYVVPQTTLRQLAATSPRG